MLTRRCLRQDPKVYVQTTLDVHKKYNALVMSAFNNDAGFVAALDKVRPGTCVHQTPECGPPGRILTRSLRLFTGLRQVHQQQRRHPDGAVVQQIAGAAGQILRLFAEEEVGLLTRRHVRREESGDPSERAPPPL